MHAVCAISAHSATTKCARYAHDTECRHVHGTHMDAQWLKDRKRELGLTDAQLAPAMGVERSVANKIANGKVILNARRADAVAKLLAVSRDEVLFRFGISEGGPGAGEPVAADTGHNPSNESIPMVGIRNADAEFGMGAVFADEPTEVQVLQFPKVWVESITYSPAELLSWVRARGMSMAPTINDGDIVLLDHSERRVATQDDIWAFTVGDTRAIKRLRVKGDRFVILSDNPSVPPDEEPIDFVNIVARVIFVGKRT